LYIRIKQKKTKQGAEIEELSKPSTIWAIKPNESNYETTYTAAPKSQNANPVYACSAAV